MKNGVNIKFITIFSVIAFHVRHLGGGGGGIHGGQIQPVTTHLRVNIRECILSIKQYGGHL